MNIIMKFYLIFIIQKRNILIIIMIKTHVIFTKNIGFPKNHSFIGENEIKNIVLF